MTQSYPVWVNNINNSYKSDKSYGVRDYSVNHYKVGTSAKNSYDFIKTEIKVLDQPDGTKVYVFEVDDVEIKRAVYDPKNKHCEIEHLVWFKSFEPVEID